jgi:phage-related tail protein
MPIITHEDEILLAKIDVEVSEMFKKIASKIDKISDAEKSLGEIYQDYTKDLQEYARKMRDKSKQMEILAREERSGVEKAEVDDYKKKIVDVEEQIKMIEGYYDRLKDLAGQKRSMTKRMEEYVKMVQVNAKIRREIVELGLKIEKDKNKMVAAESISKVEDKLKDSEREFERSKKEMDKKWEQLVEERGEVNAMWKAFKAAVDEFE